MNDISIFEEGIFESVFIKVYLKSGKYKIISSIYRPPGANLHSFLDKLENIFMKLRSLEQYSKADEMIFMGDFNIDLQKCDTHGLTNDFLSLMLTNSFLPVITLPTHNSEKNCSLIDNIFTTKRSDVFEGGIILEYLSDHLPCFYLNLCKEKQYKTCNEKMRNMSEKNVDKFCEKLSNKNWSSAMNESDPQTAFESFSQNLASTFNDCFPWTEKTTNRRKYPISPWMNQDLLSLRKKRDKLWKQKLKNPSSQNNEKFKETSKLYRNKIRYAKKSYYEKKFEEYSKDAKKTWSMINSFMKTKKKNSLPSVFHDEVKSYENVKDICEGFNDFFVGIGEKLAGSIPPSNKTFEDYMGNPINQNFTFARVTRETILSTLKQLKPKRSYSEDNISMYLLKRIIIHIIDPLVYLFDLSLQSGFIPQEYKVAKIVTIHKGGVASSFDNYRPISILPAFSKLLEKIVANQLMKYLDKFEILYKDQYGFRKKHNTTQPLLKVLDRIFNGLNKNVPEYSICLFLDLKKAFDTVNVSYLSKKLEFYGLKGKAKTWFKNYLTGRQQYVSIDGTNSTKKYVSMGIPQGSVLGPILFLLYINDLPNATKLFTYLFADDTSMINSSNDLKKLIKETNNELRKALDWFNANRLSLNIGKTKYMLFRNNSMPFESEICKIKIGGQEIERIGRDCKTKTFKFVGLMLDDNFTWEYHVNHVQKKVSSSIYALNQSKKFLPIKAKTMIYNSLIKPHLEYGSLVWGLAYGRNIEKIKTLQKKAVRMIINAPYNAHTMPILGQLGLLTFDDLVKLNIIEFVSKFKTKLLPKTMQDLFTSLLHSRTGNLKIQIPKYKSLESLPSVVYPKIWNSLSLDLKTGLNSKEIKTKLKKDYICSYKRFQCTKQKCYPCNRNTTRSFSPP